MKPELLKRIRYKFDNSMAGGSLSVIFWLAVFTFFILCVFALAVILMQQWMLPDEEQSFGQALYNGFSQMFFPAGADWEASFLFKTIVVCMCISGLVIVGILIGLISAAIEEKIEDLRRGRSQVLEKNHIIIYGWTSKIFLVIEELIIANENVPRTRICIMANNDKVEMENEINEKIIDFKTSKVIVRSGNVTDVDDLNIMSPQMARAIIILPTEDENSDMHVIKTLMALVNSPQRKEGKYNIITEINDPSIIKVAGIVANDEVSLIQTSDVIARMMVQTARQPGMSAVYHELLGFEGNEIYFHSDQGLYGKSFEECLSVYPFASPFGIRKKNGEIILNPDKKTTIDSGDLLISIAEDDDARSFIHGSETDRIIESKNIISSERHSPETENTLVVGWNEKAYTMVTELDNYVQPGSGLTVVTKFEEHKKDFEEFAKGLKKLKSEIIIGDTCDFELLEKIPLKNYQHGILLSYDSIDQEQADSYTLVTLIQLRALSDQTGTSFNIVSEMRDPRNKALAELAKPDDYVISNNITSLILAQLSENKELKPVFMNLFSAEGSEVYLKPVINYVTTGVPLSFYHLVKSALEKNEVAIGYRVAKYGKSKEHNFGIIINPDKNQAVSFSENDSLIVISED